MRTPRRLLLAEALCFVVNATMFAPGVLRANVMGFSDSSGFTVNVNDSGPAPTMSGGTIQITNAAEEERSIFYNLPQNISSFTASFTYQTNIFDGYNSGLSFVLQNSSSGASELPASPYDYVGYLNFPATSCGVTLECHILTTAAGFTLKGTTSAAHRRLVR